MSVKNTKLFLLGASLMMLGAQPSLGSDDRAYREGIQDAISTTRTQMHSPHEQEKVFDHQKGQPSRKSEDLPTVEIRIPRPVVQKAVEYTKKAYNYVKESYSNFAANKARVAAELAANGIKQAQKKQVQKEQEKKKDL